MTTILDDGSAGYFGYAPYDRILVTAVAPKVNETLIKELAIKGILVIPVGQPFLYQELLKVRKEAVGKVIMQNLSGVTFVPLTGKDGWHI